MNTIGREIPRLLFAFAVGGAVLALLSMIHMTDVNPIFSGILAGVWGMHAYERTP